MTEKLKDVQRVANGDGKERIYHCRER